MRSIPDADDMRKVHQEYVEAIRDGVRNELADKILQNAHLGEIVVPELETWLVIELEMKGYDVTKLHGSMSPNGCEHSIDWRENLLQLI